MLTDYKQIIADYENMNDYDKAVGDYYREYFYTLVFCKHEALVANSKSTKEFSIDYLQIPGSNGWKLPCYTINILTGQAQINHTNGIMVKLAKDDQYAWPYEIPNLQQGEIILTQDFYNSIFYDDLNTSHIGEKISIQISDKSGRNIVTLQDLTIKDIAANDAYGGDTFYVSQREYDALYPLSVNAVAVMINTNGVDDIEAFLQELRSYGYYVLAPFSMDIYNYEMKFHTFYPLFWGAAGGLLIFSILFIMNFITTGVVSKKKEIGILRALGAQIIDTEKIFILESAVIATIIAFLSLVLLVIETIVINICLSNGIINGIQIISFNFANIPILIIISYVITALSAVMPTYRISKMKPADAIKRVV